MAMHLLIQLLINGLACARQLLKKKTPQFVYIALLVWAGEICCVKFELTKHFRAPVLVAVALVEQGLHYDDAVAVIREKRRGAINAKQLKWLKSYKVKNKKCIIM